VRLLILRSYKPMDSHTLANSQLLLDPLILILLTSELFLFTSNYPSVFYINDVLTKNEDVVA
jgi:hypothetical protein